MSRSEGTCSRWISYVPLLLLCKKHVSANRCIKSIQVAANCEQVNPASASNPDRSAFHFCENIALVFSNWQFFCDTALCPQHLLKARDDLPLLGGHFVVTLSDNTATAVSRLWPSFALPMCLEIYR